MCPMCFKSFADNESTMDNRLACWIKMQQSNRKHSGALHNSLTTTTSFSILRIVIIKID